jgi:hypothetical protein
MVSPQVFALNIYFLIGLLIVLGVVIVLIVAFWTSIKIWIWSVRRRKADEAEHRRRFRPDGRPYPPLARGICQGCARALDEVYHLPSGQRLCPECYHRATAERPEF